VIYKLFGWSSPNPLQQKTKKKKKSAYKALTMKQLVAECCIICGIFKNFLLKIKIQKKQTAPIKTDCFSEK
jgi:hypothetical protein